MHLRPQVPRCIMLLVLLTTGFAQQSPRDTHKTSRLLTSNDGLAILSAALESRHHTSSGPDCSHLVHVIYEQAGFPYAYVSSSDLYRGATEFRQVQHPQPGDLIVWPGHAGIIVNPSQQTFFSALRTGFGVDSWESSYWRKRGTPHFFRYLKTGPPPVLSASKPSPNLKSVGLHNAGTNEPIPTDAEPNDSKESAGGQVSSSAHTEAAPVPLNIPNEALVHATRPKPSQVASTLVDTFRANTQLLQPQDVQASHSLFVFDRIEVQKVHCKDSYGWAEVRVTGPVSTTGGDTSLKKHSERQRWTMSRRDRNTWEVILPSNVVYLPREAALRILAHQLAALTEANPESSEDRARKLQVGRMINAILEEPSIP